MKKLYRIRILKFIALLLPIALILAFSQNYLFYYIDINTDRIHDFYNEEENSLDVVIIGASEVFTGFSPAYAYDKYGFTSYMYAMDANPSSLFKHQLKEIMKSQTPQLIFVEVNGYFEADNEDEARLRVFTENIPMSINKLSTIFQFNYKDKLSCIFPFIKYHGDWQDPGFLFHRFKQKLKVDDEPSLLKGMVTYTNTDNAVPKYDGQEHIDSKDLPGDSKDYLIDFLEYCKSEQLDNVVFVRFPHKLVDDHYYNCIAYANKIGEIVTQYGYTYLNLEEKTEEIGVDPMKDFYNAGHMNVYGQIKLTEYLGDLIKNEYQITPIEQTEANKAHWEEAALYAYSYFEFGDKKITEGTEWCLKEEPTTMATLKDMISDLN